MCACVVPQSEYDSIVLECAGNLLGPLAAVVGGDVLLPSLPSLLSPLIDRLVSPPPPPSCPLVCMRISSLQKPDSSVAYKSFAIGTLAEVSEAQPHMSVT